MAPDDVFSGQDDHSPQIKFKADLYAAGECISWRKVPDAVFELVKRFGCTPTEQLVALHLARVTAKTGHFPTFIAKRTELAQETGLSIRAITKATRSLTLLGVISAHYSNGQVTKYTWSEAFLMTGERRSLVPVNQVHSHQRTTFTGTSERGAPFYIELSLELFYSSFKEYFAPHQPPFNFYVPGKRRKRGAEKDAPQGSGATIQVSRKEAWREAAYHTYDKIKGLDDALSRIYLALRASNNIEDVRYPKAALLYRATSETSIHEARQRSHLRDYLYHDNDFREFADEKTTLIGGDHDRA